MMKNHFFDVTVNDVAEPWGLFFQDNSSPYEQELEALHNNIMFYLAISLFAISWTILSWYISKSDDTKFLQRSIIISVIFIFFVIAVVHFASNAWSLYSQEPRSIMYWIDYNRQYSGIPGVHVDIAYSRGDSVLVYDRYDRTAFWLKSNLVDIPPGARWVTRGLWIYLDLGNLGYRAVPDIDPTGSFEGARLNIGTLRANHNVHTNGGPLEYVRGLPFVARE